MSNPVRLRIRALELLSKMHWFPPLLARLTLGVLFVSTGWGKVHNLPRVTAFFTELGIPFPAFHAGLVAWTELVCGALLIVGLLSRVAAVPLLVTMAVALLTAKRGEIHSLPDLFGLAEFGFAVLLVVVAIGGPGALSLDALVARKVSERGSTRSSEDRDEVISSQRWSHHGA